MREVLEHLWSHPLHGYRRKRARVIIATALASAALVITGPAAAPATLQGDLDAAAAYWQAAPARCSSESVFVGRTPPHVLGEATLPDAAASEPCEMKISRDISLRMRCL